LAQGSGMLWDWLSLCGRTHCVHAERERKGEELVLSADPSPRGNFALELRTPRQPDILLGEVLGSGEYSTVYEAKFGERRVAAKVLDASKVANNGRDLDADFRKEARILASLAHPALLSLLTVLPRTLVMPIAAGTTLATVLYKAKQVLACPEALARQLTSGVAHLHQRNVLHRDLKPENVMVDLAHGKLTVIDFGMALDLAAEPEGPRDTFDGSPLYASPEALLGAPLSLKQEVWALGCVIMEMFGAGRPFKHVRNLQDLKTKLGRGSKPFAEAPMRLSVCIPCVDRCFSRTPARRPTAAELTQIFVHAEAAVLDTT